MTSLDYIDNNQERAHQMLCPDCGSINIGKRGIREGRQRYRCLTCRRSFIEAPKTKSARRLFPQNVNEEQKHHILCPKHLGANKRRTHNPTDLLCA